MKTYGTLSQNTLKNKKSMGKIEILAMEKEEKMMDEIKNIIFVCNNGNCRSQIAAGIFNKKAAQMNLDIRALSRGIVVLFEEPLNQKAEAVMLANGIDTSGLKSQQLKNEEFSKDVLVLVMERKQKEVILSDYDNAQNVFVFSEYNGKSGDIVQPYGKTLTVYDNCYKMIQEQIDCLLEKWRTDNARN
ncbi:protein-tyrosine phosphatase [Acetitomaculum ruminis DSM 5522]|uniref:Protein-tyrosine phosphatase n=2 Tax=Acetitomaculum ruminis TaxID=2382 RepID=A0A1I0YSV8_9FIRM|nr:protein-tyrosine phosphatase [Acetitomaculum ruminis DSM 5522]